jgi:hypothetical protein
VREICRWRLVTREVKVDAYSACNPPAAPWQWNDISGRSPNESNTEQELHDKNDRQCDVAPALWNFV